MRSTKLAFAFVTTFSVLAAKGALAQERFARAKTFAVSVDRAFGVVAMSGKQEFPTGTEKQSYTTINFLSHTSGAVASTMYYGVPRLAGDYFIIDGLSVGAALGVMSYSASAKSGNTAERDLPSGSAFLFAPRAGYCFMFTEMLGLWPRGGFTYVGGGTDSPDDTSSNGLHLWAFTAEVPFVISPVPHWGFHIGPTMDLGFAGGVSQKRNNTTVSYDASATEFGLHAGMFGYF